MGTAGLDRLIRAERAVVDGREQSVAIGVADGAIAAIWPLDVDNEVEVAEVARFGSEVVVLPGLVDTHVHICEPGTDWEGFATATAAAAAGGVTTLADMPIDSFPATLDVASLESKRRSAEGRVDVDVAFWGGVVPGEAAGARSMGDMLSAGVVGFKCFMVDSGAPDFPPVDPATLEAALAWCAGAGVALMVHAEVDLPDPAPGSSYAAWLGSRPPATEDRAVAEVVRAAEMTGGHAHIAHLSSASSLPLLANARERGVAITVETCPHYLALAAEDVADGDTSVKCGPPVRGSANQEALWDGLREGVIDMVVSDHSPCPPAMKTGDFATSWGGISSLQLAAQVVWTGARSRGFGPADLARWMAESPADLIGMPSKGRIAVGADADLCVLAPDEPFTVSAAQLEQRHPVTPYGGRQLFGPVRATMLAGDWVVPGRQTRRGRLLRRAPS